MARSLQSMKGMRNVGSRVFGPIAFVLGMIFGVSTAVAGPNKKYLIKIREGSSPFSVNQALMRTFNTASVFDEFSSELRGVKKLRPLPSFGILEVETDNDYELLRAAQNHDLIEYIEEEKYFQPAATVSNLPSSQYRAPWLNATQGFNADVPSAVVDQGAGPKTIVAVVDTGLDISHTFFRNGVTYNTLAVNTAETCSNGLDDDGNGYVDDCFGADSIVRTGVVQDRQDHGTHVASLVKIVRDQNIAMGRSVAAGVVILPVKFIDDSGNGTTSAAIAALEYARIRGAKVINASWGAGGVVNFSQALFDVMAQLYLQYDIVITVAAGNSSSNNDVVPYFPASFNIPGLIAVGSLTPTFANINASPTNNLSGFSNYGTRSVAVLAPGGYAVDGGGDDGVWGAYSINACTSDCGSKTNSFVRKKGTSMAAPVVAGVAGVMRAMNPSLTANEIVDLIVNTVSKSSSFSMVASGGMINGGQAVTVAMSAVSTGKKTPVDTTNPYYSEASSIEAAGSSKKSGGCFSVTPVGGSGDGPMGGNSLGVFSLAYLLWAWGRRHFGKKIAS